MTLSAQLHEAALAYSRAYARYVRVYGEVGQVQGLDEFDPKHVDWECRLDEAEQERDRCKRELLAVALAVGAE